MPTFNSYLVAAYIPLRLTSEEIKNPKVVINEYFNTTDLDATRDILCEAFSQAIVSPDQDLGELSRKDLLFHYRQIVKLIEAICVLYPPTQTIS